METPVTWIIPRRRFISPLPTIWVESIAQKFGSLADGTKVSIPVRSIRFRYDSDFDAAWHPRLPELACAANGVSLMMPYAEPYVAKSVRSALSQLAEPLRTEAAAYVGQELQHHKQHRIFNEAVLKQYPSLERVDRATQWTFEKLENHTGQQFGLAFAAGFETLAYTGARWTERQLRHLFEGADPVASTLFLWHLAEEVEHKSVAYDVYHELYGRRRTYLLGMLVSTLLLMVFAWWATWTLLWAQRKFLRPRTHVRLLVWSVGFAFELLPAQFVSVLRSHHPTDLVDPPWFTHWLATYDPVTQTLPLWDRVNDPTLSDGPAQERELVSSSRGGTS